LDRSLSCPSCGAGLEYGEAGRTIRCPYCGTIVQVPETLWQPIEQARTVSRWTKYIILFLILTVVLPTCLGLLGTALGIGGGIFAAIVSVVVSFFAR